MLPPASAAGAEIGADHAAFVGAGPRPARPAEGRRWRRQHDPRASPARAGRVGWIAAIHPTRPYECGKSVPYFQGSKGARRPRRRGGRRAWWGPLSRERPRRFRGNTVAAPPSIRAFPRRRIIAIRPRGKGWEGEASAGGLARRRAGDTAPPAALGRALGLRLGWCARLDRQRLLGDPRGDGDGRLRLDGGRARRSNRGGFLGRWSARRRVGGRWFG